jgi:hypothetical protein
MCLVLARASLQSATIDECDTYLTFSALPWPSHWYPSSGNHVLNSIAVRLFTSLFGLSHLTLRSGAIMGAALFISACYRLCIIFTTTATIRWTLFVCLVFNPFTLDYLVAARGYSLALGLMMAAVVMFSTELATQRQEQGPGFRFERVVVASACLGLAFTASFPFAYVVISLLCVFVFVARRTRPSIPWRSLYAATFVPAVLVMVAITGSTVLKFPRAELYFGSKTVAEMWNSLASASFYELNPQVVNPLILPWLQPLSVALPIAFCVSLALLTGAALALSRKETDDGSLRVCSFLGAALALSFAACLAAHSVLRLPLPQGRTGSFFVPLATLLLGILLSYRYYSRVGAAARAIGIATLAAGSIYFVGCLRLSYFQEWKFDAETRSAFKALQETARTYDIREAVTSWEYTSAFKFYCVYYGQSTSPAILEMSEQPHTDRPAYVLRSDIGPEFLTQHDLTIVYRGDFSGVILAIPSPK